MMVKKTKTKTKKQNKTENGATLRLCWISPSNFALKIPFDDIQASVIVRPKSIYMLLGPRNMERNLSKK